MDTGSSFPGGKAGRDADHSPHLVPPSWRNGTAILYFIGGYYEWLLHRWKILKRIETATSLWVFVHRGRRTKSALVANLMIEHSDWVCCSFGASRYHSSCGSSTQFRSSLWTQIYELQSVHGTGGLQSLVDCVKTKFRAGVSKHLRLGPHSSFLTDWLAAVL
jgi:hypothetical protein